MKNQVLIIYNSQKENAINLYSKVESYLEGKGYTVIVKISGHQDYKKNGDKLNAESILLLITIGGDGTVLGAARDFPNIPILALNAGSVGFITQTPLDMWQSALDEFLEGKSEIASHLMFEATLYRDEKVVCSQIGLNEVSINSNGISRLVDLLVEVNDSSLGRFRADGVLISTPTGSTAYSAAAGGPVLAPLVNAFIINPVCPFSLSSRAVVVEGDSIITVFIEPHQRTKLNLTIDGQVGFDLMANDKLVVKRASVNCSIIKNKSRNFFSVLREKLHWSGGHND